MFHMKQWGMSSAAKVELYISKRPYLKEALASGIVNYSALARKIVEEESLDSFDAVKVAVSRYEDHISSEREERRSKVEEVLGKTSMNVRTNVGVVKEEKDSAIVSSKTGSGFTSVVSEGSQALISLKSPESLERTPGVLEFILSSLAAEGINVDQLISCREDTHLVVSEDKSAQVMEVLRQRM